MGIAYSWTKIPSVALFFHSIFDPTLGAILNWNVFWGMAFITFVLSIITTLVQKYGTDQKTLSEMKKRQKEIQKEMKEYRDHPQKILELNKESMGFMGEMMKISMGSVVYTIVPFILLFRWFVDYFSILDIKFLGFLSWFWFYILTSLVFSSILRKILKVA